MLRPRPFILRRLYRKFGINDTRRQLRWIYQEISLKPVAERPSSTGLIYRLLKDEPLAYILGTQPFGSLMLDISPPVLIPRPETEEWTFELLRRIEAYEKFRENWRMLDMCTGSGCIPLLLLNEWPHERLGPIQAYGIDVSEHAVALARENATSSALSSLLSSSDPQNPVAGREFHALKSDISSPDFEMWMKEHGPFDVVTSNPPYVTASEWHTLPASVKEYEDKGALVGGHDGLEFYTRIAQLVEKGPLLRPGGWLVVEIGATQGKAVKEIFGQTQGLESTEVWKDSFGNDRAVFCRAKSEQK